MGRKHNPLDCVQSHPNQEADMRTTRNLLLVILVVILIFAVIYFVRQRQDRQVATEETPAAEVSETEGGTPDEATTDSDPEPAAEPDAATDGAPTTDESPVEAEDGSQVTDTTEPTDSSQTDESAAAEDDATDTDTEMTEEETAATDEETSSTMAEEEAAETETTETETATTITYIVKPGDNLFLIGLPYGLQWTEIAAVNDLEDPNDLEVGQEILIPASSPLKPRRPSMPPASTKYTVQPGENLFRIALKYNMDWRYLARINHIGRPYIIHVGQTLTIPGQ